MGSTLSYCPFPGPGKEKMGFKEKNWCFWLASLWIHLCLFLIFSLLPHGKGLSLKSPGSGFCVEVRLLEQKAEPPSSIESEVKREKVRLARGDTHPTQLPSKKRRFKKQTYKKPTKEREKAKRVAKKNSSKKEKITTPERAKPSPTAKVALQNGKEVREKRVSFHTASFSPFEKPQTVFQNASYGLQLPSGNREEGMGGPLPPTPIQQEKPPYPPLARRKGYQGRLVLKLLVSKDGRVATVRVVKSSGYSILDRAALKTVKRWRFIPARLGSEPIPFWVEVPVVFRLDGEG